MLVEAFVKGYKVGQKAKPTEKAVQLAAIIPDIGFDYGADPGLLTQFELNIYRFSAAKSFDMARELNKLLPDSPTFADFKKKAAPILGQYNVNYLRTEYETSYSTAQNSARYYELKRSMGVYKSWRYMTVGDNRVRPAHAALHGRVFKADGDAMDIIYPPNGHGCRCYVEAVMDEPDTTKEDAIQLLQDEPATADKSTWDIMTEGNWNNNRAKTAQIYANNQSYLKEFNPDARLGVTDNGLPTWDAINKLGKSPVVERTSDEAATWYTDNAPEGKLTDYAGRPIDVELEQFTKKTTGKKYADALGRQNYLDGMKETLAEPDEVYFEQRLKPKADYAGTYDIIYFRFYQEHAIKVVTTIDEEFKIKLKTWFKIDYAKKLDSERKGILLKKP